MAEEEAEARAGAGAGGGAGAESRRSPANGAILRSQDPGLAAEPTWAHPTTLAEEGGVLLRAAPRGGNPAAEGQEQGLWQAVVLLLRAGPGGSIGVVINRPTGLRVGDPRLRSQTAAGDAAAVKEVDLGDLAHTFSGSPLYFGGFRAQAMVHIVHGREDVAGSSEVSSGVFAGGLQGALDLVQAGEAAPADFRFFLGCMAWGPGELEDELKQGLWHTAAVSRNLVLKQCVALPTPLWKEMMELMGGEFLEIARKNYPHSPAPGE